MMMTDKRKHKSRVTALTIDGVRYVLLRDRCAALGIDYPRARRFARTKPDTIPGVRQQFDRWIVPDDVTFTLPPPGKFGATKRTDGRRRYIVHANDAEHAALIAALPADCVIDPRVAAKQRRAAKRDAAANETAVDDDNA